MIFNSNNVLLSKEEFVYDKLNQLTTTKKHIIENAESQSQITSYAVYNNTGKVTKTIDPKGNETNSKGSARRKYSWGIPAGGGIQNIGGI